MKVGKVVTIEHGKLYARVAGSIRGSSVNMRGEIYHFGNIGGYLKISNALDEWIVCEIMSIKDTDPNQNDPSFSTKSVRELILKPVGTLTGKAFNLGVGVYPPLYADVEILTSKDMDFILTSKRNESEIESVEQEDGMNPHDSFALGVSKTLLNYEINININDFFQIHSAVIGNTGSGKSNTIANILQKIIDKKNHFAYGAKFIIFDTNGEYKSALESTSLEGIECRFYKPNSKENGRSNDVRWCW